VLRGLGELDLAAGDARAAAPRLRKLVGEEPDDVQAHLALAQALKASGNASAARAEEVAASTLDPDVALALRGSTATETPLTLEGEKAPALPIAVTSPEQAIRAELLAKLPALLRTSAPLATHEDATGGSIVFSH